MTTNLRWHLIAVALLVSASALPAMGEAQTQDDAAPVALRPASCYEDEMTIAECLMQDVERLEARLTRTRAEIATAVLEDQQELFAKAEKSWELYVDATCRFDAAGASGNSRGSRYAYCKLAFTRGHLRALIAYAKCWSGSALCGNDFRIYPFDNTDPE